MWQYHGIRWYWHVLWYLHGTQNNTMLIPCCMSKNMVLSWYWVQIPWYCHIPWDSKKLQRSTMAPFPKNMSNFLSDYYGIFNDSPRNFVAVPWYQIVGTLLVNTMVSCPKKHVSMFCTWGVTVFPCSLAKKKYHGNAMFLNKYHGSWILA